MVMWIKQCSDRYRCEWGNTEVKQEIGIEIKEYGVELGDMDRN